MRQMISTFLQIVFFLSIYGSSLLLSHASTHSQDDYEKLIKITFKKALSSIKELRNEHPDLTNLTEDKPSCFLSYAWGGHEDTVHRLGKDLKKAGINVKLDIWNNRAGTEIHRFTEEIDKVDFVVLAGTKTLMAKYEKEGPVVNLEIPQIADKFRKHRGSVIPIILEGDKETSLPALLRTLAFIEFQQKENYFKNIFHLLSQLYKLKADDILLKDITKEFSKKQKLFLGMPQDKRIAYLQRLQQQKKEEEAFLEEGLDNDVEEALKLKQRQLEEKKKKIIKSTGKDTNKEPVLEMAKDIKTKPSNDSSSVSSPSIGPSLPQEENQQPSPASRKKQLEQKANAGDAQAQYELGIMLRDGTEVRKRPEEALLWFEKSATQGHIGALNALSRLYLEGKDVKQDYAKALKWIDELVDLNNPEGQHRLGDMYQNGWGVERDEKEALKWYQKAASQDFEAAIKKIKLSDYDIMQASIKVYNKSMAIEDFVIFINGDLTLTSVCFGQDEYYHAKAFAAALKVNKTLTRVNLGYQADDEGAVAFADAIKQNNTLKEFTLFHDDISDKGGKAIAAAIAQNKTLTTFGLMASSIGDESAITFADTIKKNKSLTKLNLGYNKIGDKGTEALADAIKQNATLTELKLNHNQIGDKGTEALADAIKQNATLTELDLCYNKIGDKGTKALADAIKQNKALTLFDLRQNQLGNEGKKVLEDLKHSNPSLQINY